MKKVLVFALVAMLIMASCLTAIAAETTTTKYVKVDGVDKLLVETNVTGVADDTMLTYLAYKDTDDDGVIADGEIVYIDQKTGPSTFSYKTAKENLTGVTVKFGSSVADAATTEAESARVRSFTVTYNGASEVKNAPTLVADEATIWTTNFVIPENHEEPVITLNDAPIADGIVEIADGAISIVDNAAITPGAVINITSEEKEELPPAPVIDENAIKSGSFVQEKEIEGDVVEVETMTVFGIADTDYAGDWGGIIVSEEDGEFKLADVNNTTIIKYQAMAKGEDGKFAVQLVNESGTKELTIKPMYARIYVTNAGGTSYGPVITFDALN